MRKALLLTSIALLSPSVLADTIFGLYAGGGNWNTEYSGDLGVSDIDVEDALNLDDEGRNYFYVAIEHPIPVLPNIRLQSTDITTQGTGALSDGDTFGDITFGTEDVESEIDLSHTDVTLYYEVLDNWVSLDLGLTARIFDGEGKIVGLTSLETETLEVDDTVPLLYVRAQFDLPLTGLYVGADANAVGYSGNTLTDVTGRIGYNSDIIPLLDIGIEAGYRHMQLTLDDVGDLETDFVVAGPYITLNLHL